MPNTNISNRYLCIVFALASVEMTEKLLIRRTFEYILVNMRNTNHSQLGCRYHSLYLAP